ncbi:MAG: hypothetical protein VYC09_01165, partial [Verrucomicrobiota bacterium]|nr:hypothetical protein [Verrucomicrobiota bacterium]
PIPPQMYKSARDDPRAEGPFLTQTNPPPVVNFPRENLKQGYDWFESEKVPPRVGHNDRIYTFKDVF